MIDTIINVFLEPFKKNAKIKQAIELLKMFKSQLQLMEYFVEDLLSLNMI